MTQFYPLPPLSNSLATLFPYGPNNQLASRKATVIDAIYPNCPGRVKFQGTDWPAECEQDITLAPGKTVYVIDREGLTLIVKVLQP